MMNKYEELKRRIDFYRDFLVALEQRVRLLEEKYKKERIFKRIESLEHWREEHDPIYKDDPQREIRETPKKHETHHGLEIEDLVPVRETRATKTNQHPCYKCKYAKPGRTDRWQDTDCTRRRMCHKWHVWAVEHSKGLEFFCPICGQPTYEKDGYLVCSMERCGWSER